MKRVVLGLLLLGVFSGCSRLAPQTPAQRFYYVGQGLDLATTAYGMCVEDYKELNPLLSVGGQDCATVVLSSALIKWGLTELLFYFERKQSGDKKYVVTGSIGAGAGAYNIYQLSQEE